MGHRPRGRSPCLPSCRPGRRRWRRPRGGSGCRRPRPWQRRGWPPRQGRCCAAGRCPPAGNPPRARSPPAAPAPPALPPWRCARRRCAGRCGTSARAAPGLSPFQQDTRPSVRGPRARLARWCRQASPDGEGMRPPCRCVSARAALQALTSTASRRLEPSQQALRLSPSACTDAWSRTCERGRPRHGEGQACAHRWAGRAHQPAQLDPVLAARAQLHAVGGHHHQVLRVQVQVHDVALAAAGAAGQHLGPAQGEIHDGLRWPPCPAFSGLCGCQVTWPRYARARWP